MALHRPRASARLRATRLAWEPCPLNVAPEVAAALEAGRPVVALESTIISHGLPRPRNHAAAVEFEEILRSRGVTPATIAVLDGVPQIGLDAEGVRRIADEDLTKASVRDLPILAALGRSGATTVAATAHLAARAGIRVFATGGLGGVHRGASETFDESADLSTLAVTPITVVSAGVKSVLDIPATLERLETLSVTVVGYGTTEFPAFWLRESGYQLDWSVENADQVAAIMRARDEDGSRSGIVVANPIPLEQQWDPAEHDAVLASAFAAADAAGVRGKAVTPFLLGFIVEASGGRSLEVNLDLARNNVRVAADIATAFARVGESVTGSRILVVGDIVNDIVVVPRGTIRPDTDTSASIRPRPGGSAANTAAWLGSLGAAVDFVGSVGAADAAAHEQVFRDHGVEPRLTVADDVAHRHDRDRRRWRAAHDAHRARRERRHRRRLGHRPVAVDRRRAASERLHGSRRIRRARGARGPRAGRSRGGTGVGEPRIGRVSPGLRHPRVPRRDRGHHAAVPESGRGSNAHRRARSRSRGGRPARRSFPIVVLTLGADGVLVAERGRSPVRVAAPTVRVVDPTGAGDAFTAGFLENWVRTGDAVAAAEAGVFVAARAVMLIGGRPPI